LRPEKSEWAPEQPEQDNHQGEAQKRKRQPTLAVKCTVKEVGIHVDAEPRNGYNPYGILENGDGKDAQGEADLFPGILKENVLYRQAGNEQRQP